MKLKLESMLMWFCVSTLIFFIVKIIEYITGQVGNPEWVVDFIPYWLTILFIIFDSILDFGDEKKEVKK